MPGELAGISDFTRRLEKIAQECGEKVAKPEEPKDEFTRLKQRVYEILEQVRIDIRQRQTVLKSRGNTVETIQKGHAIRQQLDELKRSLPMLQELHKRAQCKKNAQADAKKEELQARYQDIRVLKKLVDEVNELFAGTGAACSSEGSGGSPRAALLGLREAARAPRLVRANDEDTKRELTSEEQEALGAFRAGDQDIDKQVDALGNVITRLGGIAHTIGHTADRQRQRAEGLGDEVEKATEEMMLQRKKMEELMRYKSQTNCCCYAVLIIALLCCASYIFSQLKLGPIR